MISSLRNGTDIDNNIKCSPAFTFTKKRKTVYLSTLILDAVMFSHESTIVTNQRNSCLQKFYAGFFL